MCSECQGRDLVCGTGLQGPVYFCGDRPSCKVSESLVESLRLPSSVWRKTRPNLRNNDKNFFEGLTQKGEVNVVVLLLVVTSSEDARFHTPFWGSSPVIDHRRLN